MEIENWIKTTTEKLENKTQNYTNQEKSKIGFNYLKSVLRVASSKMDGDIEVRDFQTKFEKVVDSLPTKKNGNEINYGTYPSTLTSFKKEIKKKFNIVNKGTYLSRGVGAGMALGVVLGFLLLDNLALGLPIGLMLGLIIGSALESKAKKENRILN